MSDKEQVNLNSYKKVFYGDLFAVALTEYDGKRVGVEVLLGRGTYYYRYPGDQFSAYWSDDLMQTLFDAKLWIMNNCEPFKADNSDITEWRWKD